MDALQIWREGNAAALEAVGHIIDADLCRRGQFDNMPSARAFQEVIEKALLHPTNKTSPPCPKCGGDRPPAIAQSISELGHAM